MLFVASCVCQCVSEAVDDATFPSDDVTSDVDKLNDDVMLHIFTFLSLCERVRCERGETRRL